MRTTSDCLTCCNKPVRERERERERVQNATDLQLDLSKPQLNLVTAIIKQHHHPAYTDTMSTCPSIHRFTTTISSMNQGICVCLPPGHTIRNPPQGPNLALTQTSNPPMPNKKDSFNSIKNNAIIAEILPP